MKRLILDTNILLRDPSILTRWNSNFKIIIPDIIIEEARKVSEKRSGLENLFHLIDNAASKGFLIIAKVDRNKYPYDKENSDNRISFIDYQLAQFTKDYSKEKVDTFLVSEDRKLLIYANEIGVKTLNLYALQNLLFAFKTVNIDEVEKGKTIYQFQLKHLAISFVSGIILSIISYFIFKNKELILSIAPIWVTYLLLLIIAFVFYWTRANYRISYAIAEFSFGLYSSYWALNSFLSNFNIATFISSVPVLFPLLGGIYVMVRGLTNFGDGLKGTSFENNWSKIFPF